MMIWHTNISHKDKSHIDISDTGQVCIVAARLIIGSIQLWWEGQFVVLAMLAILGGSTESHVKQIFRNLGTPQKSNELNGPYVFRRRDPPFPKPIILGYPPAVRKTQGDELFSKLPPTGSKFKPFPYHPSMLHIYLHLVDFFMVFI